MRRGSALVVVLLVLALTSAISIGGAYLARQLIAGTRWMRSGASLESAAEALLVDAVAAWDSVSRAAQPVASVTGLGERTAEGIRARGWITRTSARTYWLVAEASMADNVLIRRRLGASVEVRAGVVRRLSQRAWAELP